MECYQYIDYPALNAISMKTCGYKLNNPESPLECNLLGKIIMHEFAEGYEGGLRAIGTRRSLDRNSQDDYVSSHIRAGILFPGDATQYYDNNGNRIENVWILGIQKLKNQ